MLIAGADMNATDRLERACSLMPMTVHQLAQCLSTSHRYIRALIPRTRVYQCGTAKGTNGRPWNLYALGK
jgi:hypothetical protein